MKQKKVCMEKNGLGGIRTPALFVTPAGQIRDLVSVVQKKTSLKTAKVDTTEKTMTTEAKRPILTRPRAPAFKVDRMFLNL
jgi:hypothetical protein